MNILIADDHELLAQAVAEALSKDPDFSVTVTASFAGVLQKLSALSFDVVLLDLRMPGMSGLSSIASVLRRAATCSVVIFTGQIDKQFLDDAVKLGVKGYIPKSMPLRALDVALKLIAAGQTFIPHLPTQGDVANSANASTDPLSDRELLVLRLAADGFINKEIGRDIGISEAQVKMIMRAVCQKLGSRNRAHACIVARERMLI
ncbi:MULTISPECIES: response regulator transcription factor [Roseinatronobacter]|uniref:Response regulator transcription factor n=1 Tax=Roseinatronobacter domitianus TaxID=2940293 RepID=A0ABT0M5D6_9RHOB|nr:MULTISPECIES: response regulator transcription factor [Roseibaca]MCL1630071.1 response regulator transcription factor [Roseibaca domitiana]